MSRARRLIAAGAIVLAGALVLALYQRHRSAVAAACHREAEQLAKQRGYAETVYGSNALLVEHGKVLMRDAEGRVHRVSEDVYARQLGQGWRPADEQEVRAYDVETCVSR